MIYSHIIELDKLTQHQLVCLWLTKPQTEKLRAAFDGVTNPDGVGGSSRKDGSKTEISNRAKSILSSFITCYDYVQRKPENRSTYRILVKKEEFTEKEHSRLVKTNRKSRFLGDVLRTEPDYYHELQIICMSPAVAFDRV